MQNFDVVTFGSAVKDVFVNTGEIGKKKFIYDIGSKVLIKELKFDIGGGGTNTAVAFSRLGFKTGCIAKVGKDNNGKDIVELLRREGVKFLGSFGNGKTGFSVILNSHKKGRAILTYKGEANNIDLNEIRKFKTKWLYYSALLGKSLLSQKSLAKEMVGKGSKLAFNPSSYLIKREKILDLINLSFVLIVNLEEAKTIVSRFLKKREISAIANLCPIVVITNRDKEVLCFHEGKKYSVKPNKKAKVVERTGAGDAFASGFVAGLMCGWDIERCLRFGILESESVIKYFGAKNKLIRRKLR